MKLFGSKVAAPPAFQREPSATGDTRAALPGVTPDEAVTLLRAFEETGQGWFWATDADGRLTYLTDAVALQLGASAAAGPVFAELFERPENEAGPLRSLPLLMTKQARFERVRACSTMGDETRWWSLSGEPQHDAAGGFAGYRGNGVDITDDRRSSEHAAQLALNDALTGLPNRLRMQQVLDASIAGIEHHKRGCAVMLMDLDRFKHVNDTLGHPAGDALLVEVSRRLTRIVGEGEKVFRLGGDEFEIILRDCRDRQELERIAGDLIALVSQPYWISGSRCVIGASIGIALGPDDGCTAGELIRNADLALYAAKDGGRGRCCFFTQELLQAAEDRRLVESELGDALANGELELVYQPVVCARDNRPTGVEALIRWNHPVRGPVSPGLFVPIAEEANLIQAMGEWSLRKACHDAMTWPGRLRVAVNVSVVQFSNPAFPEIVLSALSHSALPPDRLELEITEGVFLGQSSEIDDTFATLKKIGVRLALDDFGTGYSSLSYLKTAPFDKIKIDQSFIRQATLPGSRNAAIIAAVVALAEALDMETTAEGVETLDQLELIKRLRVSHAQGYLYSPGVPSAYLSERLETGDWTIEPVGPAKQRSNRSAMYRRAGAIYGNHYQSVLIRNLSETGALVEGLPDLPLGTLLMLDFGGGEIAFARVRRASALQHGVEFDEMLIRDEQGRLHSQQRVSAYEASAAGLPSDAAKYPERPRTLHQSYGTTTEKVAGRLGLNPKSVLSRRSLGSDGAQGGQGVMMGLSFHSGNAAIDRRLSAEDVDKLLEAARASGNPQLKHIVALLTLTGARQREILEARWADVDLEKGVWDIPDPATGEKRALELSQAARAVLDELPRSSDCLNVFVNPKTGRPYRSFASSWETARKKAGLPYIELDELRHAAAA